MKERLIKIVKTAPCGNGMLGEYFNTSYIENCIVQHLLANSVIVPKLNIGTMVYSVKENSIRGIPTIATSKIRKIVIMPDYIYYLDDDFNTIFEIDIGKTVFLTKEEAEQKLKERDIK